MKLFHCSLNPGAFLLLGSAESIGTAAGLFSRLAGKSRIYRRLDAPGRVLASGFPAAFGQTYPKLASAAEALDYGKLPSAPNLELLVEKMVLQRYAAAAVLVTDQGELLYFSGKTGKYLEPAAGTPSVNLFAMAREGLNQALGDALTQAVQEQTVVTLRHVKVASDGAPQYVDIIVQPIEASAVLPGMALIVFIDVPGPRHRNSRSKAAELAGEGARLEVLLQELRRSREGATATREEMQTSQEELKSTNEELQSANEELTTSKEEMQSMNQELHTLNHELQFKVTELSRASNDMRNLLDSTEIATLFLDDSLNVRRFTTQTTGIIKLIPGDMGRPITDIVTDLNSPEMAQDAREVLHTLVFRQHDVPATDGRWFKVRTMPYRTQENRIDGLVITFSDISASKKLEAELRATQARLQTLMESSKLLGVGDGLS